MSTVFSVLGSWSMPRPPAYARKKHSSWRYQSGQFALRLLSIYLNLIVGQRAIRPSLRTENYRFRHRTNHRHEGIYNRHTDEHAICSTGKTAAGW